MYLYKDLFGEDMMFSTFDEFMIKRKYLKDSYTTKDYNYRLIYKLYVESRPFIKDYFRGCCWDYLNDYVNEETMISNYFKYKQKKGEHNE